MRQALIAALAVTVVAPGIAAAQIVPIVIREANDHPGCQLYLKSDGSRLMYKGKPIAAGGRCPAEFLPGRVTRFGADSYRLQGQDLDCIINPQGLGRCTREPPVAAPPAPQQSGPLPNPG